MIEYLKRLVEDSAIKIVYELYRIFHKAKDGVFQLEFEDSDLNETETLNLSEILLTANFKELYTDKNYIENLLFELNKFEDDIFPANYNLDLVTGERKLVELFAYEKVVEPVTLKDKEIISVMGHFKDLTRAHEAEGYLLANGFTSKNIDIISHNYLFDSKTNVPSYPSSEDSLNDRIGNFFKNLFGSDEETNSRITPGHFSITVMVHAQTSREAAGASVALKEYGATIVKEYNITNETSGTSSSVDSGSTSETNNQNELNVGKQMIQTGAVRLRSRLIEGSPEERAGFRILYANVKQSKGNRLINTEAEFANFNEGKIELPKDPESPVGAEDAKVVEEVSLGKEVSEREVIIQDLAQHIEVETKKVIGKNDTDDKI